MGICKFCNEKAGIFSSQHRACKQKNDDAIISIIQMGREAINNDKNLLQFQSDIERVADQGYLPKQEIGELLIKSWEKSIEDAFEDGLLEQKEEDRLVKFAEHFSLSEEDVNEHGAYQKLVKGAVIRDLTEGNMPSRIQIDITLPFNFQKSETVVWVFPNVFYYEDKNKVSYVGGSTGASIRVAKGLYLRQSAFKGHKVETTAREFIEDGLLVFTSKHIYFAGDQKSFKIPYKKIVSFRPFETGFGVVRDAQTAKPQIFYDGDGWFSYNLVTNLAQMDQS